jgi:predicted ester cyclase
MSTTAEPIQTEMEARNINTVRRVLREVWEQGNTDVCYEMFTEDMIRHDSQETVKGPDGYKWEVEQMRSAMPDLKVEVAEIFAHAEKVTFRIIIRGTHLGDLFGIKPTGVKLVIEMQVHTYFRDDGMCYLAYVATDYLAVVQQLLRGMSWAQRLRNMPAMMKQAKL